MILYLFMSKKIVLNIVKFIYFFSYIFGKIDFKFDFLDFKMDVYSVKVGDRFFFF